MVPRLAHVPEYEVAGHPDLARTLVREGDRRGLRLAWRDRLLFDDNWSVPLLYLTPDHDIPLVPIHMNCIVPPLPGPEECYRVGREIADIVRTCRPAGERVAIMGTGGLSHDPGGQISTSTKRSTAPFFGPLEAGDPERVVAPRPRSRRWARGRRAAPRNFCPGSPAMGAVGDRKARDDLLRARRGFLLRAWAASWVDMAESGGRCRRSAGAAALQSPPRDAPDAVLADQPFRRELTEATSPSPDQPGRRRALHPR